MSRPSEAQLAGWGMSTSRIEKRALVHLASGIGNIVLATPLLVALDELGCTTDVLLHADYGETAELLRGWSLVRTLYEGCSQSPLKRDYDIIVPAVPPFYWRQLARLYRNSLLPKANLLSRPRDAVFYCDEQEYYLSFARQLGYPPAARPFYRLPIAPSERIKTDSRTLIIAPGCKTGEMAFKRWPHFAQLAERFADVILVGTDDDLRQADGTPFRFPAHVRSFVGQLSLRETAELMSAAGAVVGNDSGLAHVAAASGVPTVMIFGPTPHRTLGHFPPNVTVLRLGLECEPCWFGARFRACAKRIDCLTNLSVATVECELKRLLGIEPVVP